MGKLILELPEDITEALRVPSDEQESRLRRELSIRLYEKGLLSFGKARALAGMNKWDFHKVLGEEGVVRHYDSQDLDEDLRTLATLREGRMRSGVIFRR